jgi:hypothetical protein
MADPMTSNEIEDVLSSIRRLVAQDLKPSDRARLAAVADATQKLVLAPDQRVEEPSDGATAKLATVRRPSRRIAFPPVDSVLDSVGAMAGGAEGQKPEPLVLGAQMQPPPEAPPTPAEPQWQKPDFLLPQSSDVEPDLGDEFNIDPNARMFDVAASIYGKTDQPISDISWAQGEPDDVTLDDTPQPEVQSLHGTIEPDPNWADQAEARVIAELAGEAIADEVTERAADSFAKPHFPPHSAAHEVLFDEDQLRAMVQAIFREEMAGPMGERITRNIRKLVRAEVGRMLAAQELE